MSLTLGYGAGKPRKSLDTDAGRYYSLRMAFARAGRRSSGRGVCRAAIALFILASLSLGILPISLERPREASAQDVCCFEPLDVCNAGNSSLGMLADLPVLLPAPVALVAVPTALPAPSTDPAALLEGSAPGVYRPPRCSSC
jgi:hypothetical protein